MPGPLFGDRDADLRALKAWLVSFKYHVNADEFRRRLHKVLERREDLHQVAKALDIDTVANLCEFIDRWWLRQHGWPAPLAEREALEREQRERVLMREEAERRQRKREQREREQREREALEREQREREQAGLWRMNPELRRRILRGLTRHEQKAHPKFNAADDACFILDLFAQRGLNGGDLRAMHLLIPDDETPLCEAV